MRRPAFRALRRPALISAKMVERPMPAARVASIMPNARGRSGNWLDDLGTAVLHSAQQIRWGLNEWLRNCGVRVAVRFNGLLNLQTDADRLEQSFRV